MRQQQTEAEQLKQSAPGLVLELGLALALAAVSWPGLTRLRVA